jgi:predicted DNA-binding transcriptional regulator AlpA
VAPAPNVTNLIDFMCVRRSFDSAWLRTFRELVEDVSTALMDEKELCSTLGIAAVTATKWRAKGEGPPFVKLGRLVRYRRTEVAEWLADRHHEPTS